MVTWNLFITKPRGSEKSYRESYYSFRTKTEMLAWAKAHKGTVKKRSPANKYDYQFVR